MLFKGWAYSMNEFFGPMTSKRAIIQKSESSKIALS